MVFLPIVILVRFLGSGYASSIVIFLVNTFVQFFRDYLVPLFSSLDQTLSPSRLLSLSKTLFLLFLRLNSPSRVNAFSLRSSSSGSNQPYINDLYSPDHVISYHRASPVKGPLDLPEKEKALWYELCKKIESRLNDRRHDGTNKMLSGIIADRFGLGYVKSCPSPYPTSSPSPVVPTTSILPKSDSPVLSDGLSLSDSSTSLVSFTDFLSDILSIFSDE